MPADAIICVSCGYNLQTGNTVKAANARTAELASAAKRLAKGAGTFAFGSLLAVIVALLGAGAWCAIAVKTGIEFGLIAWGLGALVGAAMFLGYRQQNLRAGVTAACISAFGLLIGKFLVFTQTDRFSS